jgi:hypothetical protein
MKSPRKARWIFVTIGKKKAAVVMPGLRVSMKATAAPQTWAATKINDNRG